MDPQYGIYGYKEFKALVEKHGRWLLPLTLLAGGLLAAALMMHPPVIPVPIVPVP
jgi:hypothetical protein